MIIAVTLNPALDKTIEIDDYSEGSINEVINERMDIAGKGINVSKVIKELNGECLVITFYGGYNGKIMLDFLDKNKIKHIGIKTNGETRRNLKIHDKAKNIVTDINAKGPYIYENELELFIDAINKNIKKDDIVIFSGSIPRGINKDIYKILISAAKEKGGITFLDSDGEALEKGLEAKPFLVRHNVHELEKIYKVKINSANEVIDICKNLIDDGIQNVYVALDKLGSVFVSKNKSFVIEPLDVHVKSKVGTGDSFVAGMAYSYSNNYALENAIKLAAACATATITMEGSKLGKIEDIKKYTEQIKITQI
jgi:1-phosphofructokinase